MQSKDLDGKHEQLFGIFPGMGGGQNCLRLAVFSGKEGNTKTKLGNLKKMLGQAQSRGNPVKSVFMHILVCCFLPSPTLIQNKPWEKL